MKVTMMQANPVVGDLKGNVKYLCEKWESAFQQGSDLIVTPELYITGYPPRDFLERPWFVDNCQHALDDLILISNNFPGTGLITGVPVPAGKSRHLYNAAVLIYQGQIIFQQYKSLLPVYDVFDETRYFQTASDIKTVMFKGECMGLSICEDAWNNSEFWPRERFYDIDPIDALAEQGATLLINISASPFNAGKEKTRFQIIKDHAVKHHLPFIYVNQVGGNDELLFDGGSLFINGRGEPVKLFPSFCEHCEMIETTVQSGTETFEPPEETAIMYAGLVTGIKDYLHKCGFSRAVIGLSGGIDSAVTCCLACEALGSENVLGIAMPSPYSSSRSVEDAGKLAGNLGIEFKVINISEIYKGYEHSLKQHLPITISDPGLTLENIQARIRGNILMAFSNQQGSIVLSTGNKSEMAVGYCTLYGDMSGGLSVLADVPKTMVYQLAEYINRHGEILPQQIITRAPSAELKPDQLDQDSLPPYKVLDPILHLYIEKACSPREIVAQGFDEDTVLWVCRAVDRNEYKRQQAAPGLRISSKAFGTGRRMPLAARQGYYYDV